jgi:hypothetical protein
VPLIRRCRTEKPLQPSSAPGVENADGACSHTRLEVPAACRTMGDCRGHARPGRGTRRSRSTCAAMDSVRQRDDGRGGTARVRAIGHRPVSDFDADDWWYRCRFPFTQPTEAARIRFGGLATVADAWLNGHHILHSESMFVAQTVRVERWLSTDNELILRFHALTPLLASKRPRPRWRTKLVSHQALRWHRTSLLGRMPAWCPPVAPVGPWRPIEIEASPLHIEYTDLRRTETRRGDDEHKSHVTSARRNRREPCASASRVGSFMNDCQMSIHAHRRRSHSSTQFGGRTHTERSRVPRSASITVAGSRVCRLVGSASAPSRSIAIRTEMASAGREHDSGVLPRRVLDAARSRALSAGDEVYQHSSCSAMQA